MLTLENLPLLFLAALIIGIFLFRHIASNIAYGRKTHWERERSRIDPHLTRSLWTGKNGGKRQ